MNDEDLFKNMVGGDVKPIKADTRVPIAKTQDEGVDKAKRRLAAEALQAPVADPLATSNITMVDPMAIISYRRPGVQHGVYKNLRLGKYALEARLDLHKMRVEEARRSVYRFIQDCVSHDVRSALITHGKGEGRETPAMLKSCVAHWLPQMEEVLAFHTAQKQHGSYGATYVLMKKSDRKRIENAELNRKK